MQTRTFRVNKRAIVAAAVVSVSGMVAQAAVWTGASNDGLFSSAGNWSDVASPVGQALTFDTQTGNVVAVNNDLTGAAYASLTFNASAPPYTIGGNAFTLSGNITNNSSNAQTIGAATTLSNGSHAISSASRSLSLGIMSRDVGATATFTLPTSGSIGTSSANVNSILGPWAMISSGTSLQYATVNSGSIAAFTGTPVNLGGGNGGGANTATVNYDVTGGATLTGGRTVNTMRFVDTAAQTYAISTRSLTTNGLMNAGSAAWTISSATTGSLLPSTTTNEIVVATATAPITISAYIKDNGTAGAVTCAGQGGLITLSGANTYTGATTINSGTLVADRANNTVNPTSSALGNPHVARNIIVNSGATLKFNQGDTFGGATTTVSSTLVINNGGTVTNNGNNFTTLGQVQLNGGTLTGIGGTGDTRWQMYNLRGTVTVGGTSPSTISGSGTTAGYHLAAPTTFNVADVTGSSASDLNVSGTLVDQDGVHTGIGSLIKTGAGTMTLSGANTYTGATTIAAGTLALGASGSIATSTQVNLSAGATLDTTAQNFAMLTAQPFALTLDGTGSGSAGFLKAGTLDITNGNVSFTSVGTLDDGAYLIGSYSSLTGTSFATVTGLPTGASIDYHYNNGNQIAVVVPEPTCVMLAVGGMALMGLRRRRTA